MSRLFTAERTPTGVPRRSELFTAERTPTGVPRRRELPGSQFSPDGSTLPSLPFLSPRQGTPVGVLSAVDNGLTPRRRELPASQFYSAGSTLLPLLPLRSLCASLSSLPFLSLRRGTPVGVLSAVNIGLTPRRRELPGSQFSAGSTPLPLPPLRSLCASLSSLPFLSLRLCASAVNSFSGRV